MVTLRSHGAVVAVGLLLLATGWEENDASIVVTKQSVVIHRGDRFDLEITPRSTGAYEVARDHDRLSLHAGSGKSAVSWSFRPPDDAAGWAEDIRAVIRATAGAVRRSRDDGRTR